MKLEYEKGQKQAQNLKIKALNELPLSIVVLNSNLLE